MADLVAGGLPVPFEKLFVGRTAGRLADGDGGVDDVTGAFRAFGQAQQPIRTHTQNRGCVRGQLGVGKAGHLTAEKLTDGGAVNANLAGKPAAGKPRATHGIFEPLPKENGPLAFVDNSHA